MQRDSRSRGGSSGNDVVKGIAIPDAVAGSTSATAPTRENARPSSAAEEAAARRYGVVMVFPRDDGEPPASWVVRETTSVGRSRRSTIRLGDAGVSASHASLEPRGGGLFVRDAGSRHGTFVNGELAQAEGMVAPPGAILRVGDTLFLVVEDVETHRARPRRNEGARLGLAETMVAGPVLAGVWDQAARVASVHDPVLILGESGSGKECIARILHAARNEPGPFVGINVTAIPESLFEAELFGHERGAFTGANTARPGAFREASGGVLFLDEVGSLKLEVQSKLLRALDRRVVRPLGANRDVPIDARIVSATSRDLREACDAGDFRTDLYYRLSGIVIRIPPLRERPEDVILLALEALRERASAPKLSADAAEVLLLAGWEGNARQLRHAMAHATNQAASAGSDELRPEHLPDLEPLGEASRELTLERIQTAMKKSGGVAAHAARALGVSRTALYNALKRFKVDTASLRGS
jgi:DNA-binding NtrC family response regulator